VNREGVLVTRVTGRARERGVTTGDLIVSVNGRQVREPMDFFRAVRAVRPDQPVRLVVVRPGEEIDIELPSDLPPVPVTPADRRRV
jgi:S1-C subfamily serine protease